MLNKQLPSVSFVIPTFNSGQTIVACLESIARQDYPKANVEVIFGDGGSKDSTLTIANKFNIRVIPIRDKRQGPEFNRAIAALRAKNDILVFLDHDNVLPSKTWLRDMIEPFLLHSELVGAETLRYTYEKKDGILGRYFSLLCVNDVLPFYLGKADRLSYMYDSLKEYGVFKHASISDKGEYYLVRFSENAIPTLGSNGFLIRKAMLLKHAKCDPDHFFHIDVNVDLIRKGFNTYAFVKNNIYHRTQERGIIDYLRRRKLFVERYHVDIQQNRRYSVYEEKDFFRLLLFALFAVTFVKPLLDAFRGFFKIHDSAWFLHPLMAFLLLVMYGYMIVTLEIKKYAKKLFSW